MTLPRVSRWRRQGRESSARCCWLGWTRCLDWCDGGSQGRRRGRRSGYFLTLLRRGRSERAVSLGEFAHSSRSKSNKIEGLTPYWPGLSSDLAPRSTTYCHPDAQTPMIASITREYPPDFDHANLCSKWCEPVAHRLLARGGWSGTVTPRKQKSGKIQKDKREGREHVVIGSRYRGRREDRKLGNLTGFQMSQTAVTTWGASSEQPREWAVRAPCSDSSSCVTTKTR
jgi:hypothetical protein